MLQPTNRRLVVLAIAFACFTLLGAACSRAAEPPAAATHPAPVANANPAPAAAPPASPAPTAPPTMPPTAPPAAVTALDPAKLPAVVAKLDGEDITKERLLAETKARRGNMARMGMGPAPDSVELYRDVLAQIVAGKLLFKESMALGLVPTDAELDQQIATVKSQFPGEKEFTAALEAQGMTPAELRNDLRENMGIQKVIATKLEPMVQVTNEAKHQFYSENQDKMQSPEQVRASHILIKMEQGATPDQKEAARQKATDLLTQIKGGADFATLAKANSQDPGSAAKGGDLGLFPKGAMVPPFDQAAFALEVGKVSELVESPFGFHIIKVAEHKAAGVSPYEEVQEKIGQYLHNRELKTKLDAHIQELKAKAQVQVFI